MMNTLSDKEIQQIIERVLTQVRSSSNGAAKMGVQPASLLRQIQRYGMVPSAELVATARRGRAS